MAEVGDLLQKVDTPRDKAIICLVMDTGFRLSEVASIKPEDVDWQTRTVKVWGKGVKQRVGKFGDTTAAYFREHLDSYSPNGNIWGLSAAGIGTMLKRLQSRTGITCNAHSFRRAWAIETIRNGTNLIDVQALGGWESFEMVRRYVREVTSEDAVQRYRPLTSARLSTTAS